MALRIITGSKSATMYLLRLENFYINQWLENRIQYLLHSKSGGLLY